MDKKQYLLVSFLGLLLTTVAVGATTLAFGGQGGGVMKNNEERQQVQQAITDNDYTTWQTAMTTQVVAMRQRATDLEAKINQNTFDKLIQAQQLMKDGKKDEAKAIFDELGMFGPMGHMGGKSLGQGTGLRAEAPTSQK